MSRRSSLQTNSSPFSPYPNSSPAASPPIHSSPSMTLPASIANDDLEKQLPRAAQPVDSEVGPLHTEVKMPLPQGKQNATGQWYDPSDPTDHLKTGPSNLDQYADFWDVYNNEADREDNELIESLGGGLDSLLIFAGLFSATNTAFIVESYQDLKQDQSELTNKLLRNVMRTIHQPSSFTQADLLLDYDGPPSQAIVINMFFFASLCCSLFTAFGAVIGKQWLSHYGTESQLRSSSARGIERQRKYMGLEKWKFKMVVEALPALLQFSLFFFFIGLIDFMWPLNTAVGVLVLLLAILTLLFYVVTLLIGILYPNSPFQTRLTNVLREWFIPKKLAPVTPHNENIKILQARCVDWLQQRTTCSKTMGIISRAVTLLTEEGRRAINLNHPREMVAYILRSSEGQVYLGISAEGLQSSLVALKDVLFQWTRSNDVVHRKDRENTTLLLALERELWNLLLKTGTMDEEKSSTALAILEKLGPGGLRDSLDSRAKYLIESLRKPLTRQDQLVRLALLHDVLWRFPSSDANKTKKHMSEILATTMWGVDGKPDLDDRRVVLRLSWFLADNDGMYPKIQDLNFGLYLSLWRQSHVPRTTWISSRPVTRDLPYLRTVIRLLLQDQERWAKELDEHGHLAHIEAIRNESLLSDTQLVAFILLACVAGRNGDPSAPPSHYYSQARVDRVVQQLHVIHPSSDFDSWQPHHGDSINYSLHEYLQTAYQYKRIQNNDFDEVSQLAKKLMDYIRSEAISET
ncbi:hypothetical protein FRC02_012445 [Tulasnella sp. 418]|nr:hypothetical protein FRC02_012445 [Tulasnella sp. 418]